MCVSACIIYVCVCVCAYCVLCLCVLYVCAYVHMCPLCVCVFCICVLGVCNFQCMKVTPICSCTYFSRTNQKVMDLRRTPAVSRAASSLGWTKKYANLFSEKKKTIRVLKCSRPTRPSLGHCYEQFLLIIL